MVGITRLLLPVAVALSLAAPTQAAATPRCAGWRVDTVVSGLGELENLEPDGSGGFYLSGWTTDLYHLDAAGNVRTVVPKLRAGGMQLVRTTLYFVGGADHGFWQLDTGTGELTQLAAASGANGLLRLPDGDLLTTWVGDDVLRPSAGVTRYHVETGVAQANWSPVPRSEGLALSPDRRVVYTDDAVTGEIYRIPLDEPDRWSVVTRLPGLLPGPDDLAIARDGRLYVAAHAAGEIVTVDPDSGSTCAVASGLSFGWTGPTSVRIAPDRDGWALYVTAFDGELRRIRPPVGVDLAPVG